MDEDMYKDPIMRLKIVGRLSKYIHRLYHEPEINQTAIALSLGKKTSQVSRDIKDLYELGLIKRDEKKTENIISLSEFGIDVYRIINPYSEIHKETLSKGVKRDIIELINEFNIEENNIIKRDIFDRFDRLIKNIDISNWNDFEEFENFVKLLLKDFFRKDEGYYQQDPLMVIEKVVEKGYFSNYVIEKFKKYINNYDMESSDNHIIKRIFNIVLMSTKNSSEQRVENIQLIIDMLLKFQEKHFLRTELYDKNTFFEELSIDIKYNFREEIISFLKERPDLDFKELEHILRLVSK